MLDYAEARAWAVWLDSFTASDLASSMGVPSIAVQGFLIGLLFNGTIEDSGDRIPGPSGMEPIYSFVPLPPGPNEHPYETPEWLATPGVYDMAPVRGMPVVLENREKERQLMSIPGARHKHKLRKLARQRQDDAVRERANRQRRKAAA